MVTLRAGNSYVTGFMGTAGCDGFISFTVRPAGPLFLCRWCAELMQSCTASVLCPILACKRDANHCLVPPTCQSCTEALTPGPESATDCMSNPHSCKLSADSGKLAQPICQSCRHSSCHILSDTSLLQGLVLSADSALLAQPICQSCSETLAQPPYGKTTQGSQGNPSSPQPNLVCSATSANTVDAAAAAGTKLMSFPMGAAPRAAPTMAPAPSPRSAMVRTQTALPHAW